VSDVGRCSAAIAQLFRLTSITMRPTGLSSAVMSKKTRGSAMFLAAAAKLRRSVSKDGRLGRAVAPKWLECLKVESIDSRQIDLNAILRSWKSAGNRSHAIAIYVLFNATPISAAFCGLFAGYSVKILCNKRKFPTARASFHRMRKRYRDHDQSAAIFSSWSRRPIRFLFTSSPYRAVAVKSLAAEKLFRNLIR